MLEEAGEKVNEEDAEDAISGFFAAERAEVEDWVEDEDDDDDEGAVVDRVTCMLNHEGSRGPSRGFAAG